MSVFLAFCMISYLIIYTIISQCGLLVKCFGLFLWDVTSNSYEKGDPVYEVTCHYFTSTVLMFFLALASSNALLISSTLYSVANCLMVAITSL